MSPRVVLINILLHSKKGQFKVRIRKCHVIKKKKVAESFPIILVLIGNPSSSKIPSENSKCLSNNFYHDFFKLMFSYAREF